MKVTLYIAPNTIKPNFHPHTVLFTNKLSTQVLEHMFQQTEVGDTRKWTVIGCDGLPFILAS